MTFKLPKCSTPIREDVGCEEFLATSVFFPFPAVRLHSCSRQMLLQLATNRGRSGTLVASRVGWRRQMMAFADKSPLTCEAIVFATETPDYATAALCLPFVATLKCVCVFVCVCKRERERETQRDWYQLQLQYVLCF